MFMAKQEEQRESLFNEEVYFSEDFTTKIFEEDLMFL
jgi:hypothetical protein